MFTDTDPYRQRPGDRRAWGDPYAGDELDLLPEDQTTIADALRSTGSLWYEYDLGDGWIHQIDVLARSEPGPLGPPVGDIEGANRAPYEDAGGLPGYAEKLQIAADPQHSEHRFIRSWIRQTVGPWSPADPGFFDPLGAQSELNHLFHAERAGVHPHDLSGIVKDDAHRSPDDVQLESPLATLLSALPVPLRSELRQHLHRTEILEPTGVDAATARRMIEPYAWLIETVGTEGITLTHAGWLPPAVVLDAMTTLEWTKTWIGKGNREDLTVPVALLRETAQRMGLVRLQKGRLLLGADAKRALGDPHRMMRTVARRMSRGLAEHEEYIAILRWLAIADRVPFAQQWETEAFGLEVLGWQSATGSFTPDQIHRIDARIEDVIRVLTWNDRRNDRPSDDLVLFAREALR